MTPSVNPLDSLFLTIVLATLAVGLPILVVLAIRFLWDRSLSLGRSKELEKLIWQLHRIASAMEHQMNLSFPPVQPGTEEPRDIAYLQQIGAQPSAAVGSAASSSVASGTRPAPPPAAPQRAGQTVPPPPTAEPGSLPALQRRDPSVEAPRAGVNSMFDL
jgi:hypothetical protein